jgi:hypothetical protein
VSGMVPRCGWCERDQAECGGELVVVGFVEAGSGRVGRTVRARRALRSTGWCRGTSTRRARAATSATRPGTRGDGGGHRAGRGAARPCPAHRAAAPRHRLRALRQVPRRPRPRTGRGHGSRLPAPPVGLRPGLSSAAPETVRGLATRRTASPTALTAAATSCPPVLWFPVSGHRRCALRATWSLSFGVQERDEILKIRGDLTPRPGSQIDGTRRGE